jgi:hypothetical protein
MEFDSSNTVSRYEIMAFSSSPTFSPTVPAAFTLVSRVVMLLMRVLSWFSKADCCALRASSSDWAVVWEGERCWKCRQVAAAARMSKIRTGLNLPIQINSVIKIIRTQKSLILI